MVIHPQPEGKRISPVQHFDIVVRRNIDSLIYLVGQIGGNSAAVTAGDIDFLDSGIQEIVGRNLACRRT